MLTKILIASSVAFTFSISACEYDKDFLIEETDLVCSYIQESRSGFQDISYSISQEERDRIWMEMHFCIKKMRMCLDKADREASKILDVYTENAVKAAISGAVGGLSTKSAYGVAISSCLAALGTIAADAYGHVRLCRVYVSEAKYFAFRADELQEILWRNQ